MISLKKILIVMGTHGLGVIAHIKSTRMLRLPRVGATFATGWRLAIRLPTMALLAPSDRAVRKAWFADRALSS